MSRSIDTKFTLWDCTATRTKFNTSTHTTQSQIADFAPPPVCNSQRVLAGLHRCQNQVKILAAVTCMLVVFCCRLETHVMRHRAILCENSVKFGCVVFELCEQTDRQTDKWTNIPITTLLIRLAEWSKYHIHTARLGPITAAAASVGRNERSVDGLQVVLQVLPSSVLNVLYCRCCWPIKAYLWLQLNHIR